MAVSTSGEEPDDDADGIPNSVDDCHDGFSWHSSPVTDFDGDGCIDDYPLPIVGMGSLQACFLLRDGNSTCVGEQGEGQDTDYLYGDAIAIGAGMHHTCYLLRSGNSKCHGGDLDSESASYQGGDAVALAASSSHTCYLLNSGQSQCHGEAPGPQNAPYEGRDAIGLAAASLATCYLLASGNSTCYADEGDFAYNGGDAVAIAGGADHFCYLLETGNGLCRGSNEYGQATPYLNQDAVAISAGWRHTCYVLANGNGHCEGENEYGKTKEYRGGDATGVGTGTWSTCWILKDGSRLCNGRIALTLGSIFTKGDIERGDLDDDNDGVPDPRDAFPKDEAEWLDSDSDGIGNNADMDDDNDGVLDADDSCLRHYWWTSTPQTDRDGDGCQDEYPLPVVGNVGIHDYRSCVVLANGTSACRGFNWRGEADPYLGGDAVAVAMTEGFTCYLLDGGNSACLGDRAEPAFSYRGGDAVAISATVENVCYLLRNGNSHCFGHGGATESHKGQDAVQMAGSTGYRCYLLTTGNSTCYGDPHRANGANESHTGGDGVALAASSFFACYLLSDGNSKCYGRFVATELLEYTKGDAVALAAGWDYVCYVLANGNSTCRGSYDGAQYEYHGGDAIAASSQGDVVCYVLATGNSLCKGHRYEQTRLAYDEGGIQVGDPDDDNDGIPDPIDPTPRRSLDLTATGGDDDSHQAGHDSWPGDANDGASGRSGGSYREPTLVGVEILLVIFVLVALGWVARRW